MRRGIVLLVLLLAACSTADEREPAPPPADAVVAPPVPAPAPVRAARPVDCQDGRGGGHDSAEACTADQCDKGDAAACRMAVGFDGNLFPDGDPGRLRLEEMSYPDARALILALGWIPDGEDCGGGGTDETTCADFPEINYCSGVGLGYCDIAFRRADRCLDVLTTEGPPERGVAHRPYVKDVNFRKGPCHTAPEGG